MCHPYILFQDVSDPTNTVSTNLLIIHSFSLDHLYIAYNTLLAAGYHGPISDINGGVDSDNIQITQTNLRNGLRESSSAVYVSLSIDCWLLTFVAVFGACSWKT